MSRLLVKKPVIVAAIIITVIIASVVEFCAIEHGIDGKAIQAYIGIIGIAIGALTSLVVKFKREKNDDD